MYSPTGFLHWINVGNLDDPEIELIKGEVLIENSGVKSRFLADLKRGRRQGVC